MEKSFLGATLPNPLMPHGGCSLPSCFKKIPTHGLRGLGVSWGHSPSCKIPGFPGIHHLGDAPHGPAIGQLQVIAGVTIEVATRSAELVDQVGSDGHGHLAAGAEEHVHP